MAKRFASLAVLAMLIFVTQTAPASAQKSPLTPKLLSQLSELVAMKGADNDLPPVVANALGLSAPGQGWPHREVDVPDEKSGFQHLFGISARTAQDVIFLLRYPGNNLHILRSHRDGTAVAALIYDLGTHRITMLTSSNSQKELDAEIAFWTKAFAPK